MEHFPRVPIPQMSCEYGFSGSADTQKSRIHKTDTSACTKQCSLDEYGQRKQYFFLQLNETVVRGLFVGIGVSDVCRHILDRSV